MSAMAETLPTRRQVRQYSDIDKAEALVILETCRGNLSEAARITGIPHQTIADWRDGRHGITNDIPRLREFSQRDLAGKMEALAHKSVGLAYKKAGRATYRDLITGIDKSATVMQLLRGQPTSIIEERVEARAVLVLMSNALGVTGQDEDPAIDVTPEPQQIEEK